jgi:hypothetical protein
MNDVPESELLGAYLDGEVTAAERTRVEQLLASDPEARRLLDGLRALRAKLQDLPREKLDEDLGQQVLRAAQRRMLLGEDATAQTPEPPLAPWWREIGWRGMLSRRALLWSGMAVAISLMIMLNEWQHPKQHGDLARGPQPLVAPSAHKPGAAEADRGIAPPPEMRAAGGSRKAVAESPPQNAPADGLYPSVDRGSPLSSSFAAPAAAPEPAASLGPVGGVVLRRDEIRGTLAAPAGKLAPAPAPASAEIVKDAPANRAPAEMGGGTGGMGGMGGGMDGGAVGPTDGRNVRAYGAAAAAPAFEPSPREEAKRTKRSGLEPAQCIVVECRVRAEAVRSRAFEQLLVRSGLRFRKGPPKESSGKPLAVYEVEATPKKLGGVLARLAQDSKDFPSFAVQPLYGSLERKLAELDEVQKREEPEKDRLLEQARPQKKVAAGPPAVSACRVVFILRPVDDAPPAQPGGARPAR